MHQNLTHAVHPDPISGAHCWLQKAVNVRKAHPGERHGDVWVDVNRSMAVYQEWRALARSATYHSPDGTRGPIGPSARSSRWPVRTRCRHIRLTGMGAMVRSNGQMRRRSRWRRIRLNSDYKALLREKRDRSDPVFLL
ncbi:MAG: hypothetical protein R2911_25300 [Caldilineaceae bacterium]